MRRSGTRRRRSSAVWAVRGSLALLAALVGLYAVIFTIAQMVAVRNPALAHRLLPHDPRITSLLAATLIRPDASIADRTRADMLANDALHRDPSSVIAISTLAINAQARSDVGQARRLFDYAQRLSRRDPTTQLWAIENAVQRQDIPAALRHYDIALRTSPNLFPVLFPVLAAAGINPEVRGPLVRLLTHRPSWASDFIGSLSGKEHDPHDAATLLNALAQAGITIPDKVSSAVVNALIAKGDDDAAWQFYMTLRRNVDVRRSRDARFTLASDAPSLFDWVAINDNGVNATIQYNARGGLVDFTAPASVGGALLQQLQRLPPGDYVIAGRTNAIDQAANSKPYFVLTCSGGAELGRVELPNSTISGGRFAGRIRVPAGCPAQALALMAQPSDLVSGTSGQILSVQLAPAR